MIKNADIYVSTTFYQLHMIMFLFKMNTQSYMLDDPDFNNIYSKTKNISIYKKKQK